MKLRWSIRRPDHSLPETLSWKHLNQCRSLSDFHPCRFYIYINTKMFILITSLNLRNKRGGARRWFDGEMTVNLAFLLACVHRVYFYRCLIISCSFNCAIFSQACDSSPCLNGGTCFEDESGEKYICKCSSGWRGNNCEKKITGSHYY